MFSFGKKEEKKERAYYLKKLRADILKHVYLLQAVYRDISPVETLCRGIETASQKNNEGEYIKDDEAFMKFMAVVGKIFTAENNTSIATIEDTELKEQVLLLCGAFAHYDDHFETWPEISTFEELLNAEQKCQVQMTIDFHLMSFTPNTKTAFNDISKQMIDSEASTSANDLFANNLFAKTYVTEPRKKGEKRSLAENTIGKMHDFLYENHAAPEEPSFFTQLKKHIAYTNPKTVLGTEVNENEKAWQRANHLMHNDLLKMRQKYINKGRSSNLGRIDALIEKVAKMLNKPKGKSNEQVYTAIRNEIQTAFNAEKNSYVNGFVSFFSERTSEGFNKILADENNNTFCFPRMLKKILATHNQTSILKLIVDGQSGPVTLLKRN